MNERLKDILSNLNSEVDQEALMRYLEGKLTADRQQELEAQLLDNEFEAEALEGLAQMPDKKRISGIVEQLNLDLKKKTDKRKAARKKGVIKFEPWLFICMIIVLLLVIIGYIIVRIHAKQVGQP